MESKNNLELYNSLKEVPKEYTKTIQAGRLKGMSDIKPQWRIQRLTEILGPCGFGWKIQNLRFEYKEVKEEIVCNCYLEFLFKHNGEWSEPIPAIGGNKLATMERNGLHISDEAEKMAYTDAISVATKMIGLASDIYMGFGGKYDTPTESDTKVSTPGANVAKLPFLNRNNKSDGSLTKEYLNVLKAIKEGKIKTITDVKKYYLMSKEVEQDILNQLNK